LSYSGIPNGTASYAILAGKTTSASYYDLSKHSVLRAISAVSASWVSQSAFSRYISGPNVDGILTSASYAISTSYAITSSNAKSSSYSITGSSGITASYALITANDGYEPLTIFGPFVADSTAGTTTIEWECPRCQEKLDRDLNASQNILRQGLNNLMVGTTKLAVCPDIRPVRNSGQLVGTEAPIPLG